MTNCEVPGQNHSRDRVEVFHGEAAPITLCGYHASRLSPALYRQVDRAREQRARDAAAAAIAAQATPEQKAEQERLRNDPRLPFNLT